jgi:dynein heavy chain
VEVWLQYVVDAMRAALSAEFKAAMASYEQKPRAQWIFDHSVQTTVTVSRAFFTQEVNQAFAELEDGNEDALKVWPDFTLVCKAVLHFKAVYLQVAC